MLSVEVRIGISFMLMSMSRAANKDRIAALMLENTFTSIPEIARILFPVRLIQCLPVWFYKNQFRSHRKACRITQPTLFLSGLSDKVRMKTIRTNFNFEKYFSFI